MIHDLERWYPPSSAQSWDQVGLVSGDRRQRIRRIMVAVDPTLAVVQEAVRSSADLLITHHPLLLRGVHSVATDRAKGAILSTLITHRVALYCAHTNADVAGPEAGGVGHALARACGLPETTALTIAEDQELGRVGDLPEPITLEQLARRLAAAMPTTAAGLRVAGPAHAPVQRVAVLGGAGDGAFDNVRASAADVYVTADLRHHPVLEAREEARLTVALDRDSALDRAGDRDRDAETDADPDLGRPYLIDAGHYASEWLWLPELARLLQQACGPAVEVVISQVVTDPWDFIVGTGPGPEGDGGAV